MGIKKQERVSFYSHFIGAVAAFTGAVILVIITDGSPILRSVSLIYILSALFLFSASSLYHAFKKEDDEINVMRKLDHLAIFFMIAGTYTPLCYIYLEGPMLWGILITQWILVFLGLFFKLFFLNAPRILYTGIYVMMGWLVVIPLQQLISSVPSNIMIIIFAGGIFYTIGAVFYAIKRPKQIHGLFGFHEIFHIFILLGAGSHFMAVYYALLDIM